MSLFELLGFGEAKAPRKEDSQVSAPVREIMSKLEGLPPERARFVAAFAFVLARVANADLDISQAERHAIARIVSDFGEMDEAQAELVAEIAARQNELRGGTEDYLVTRELRRTASPEEKRRLLHCLFAVSAADDSISLREEEEARRVADELGLEHSDYIAARSEFRDKRAVLRS